MSERDPKGAWNAMVENMKRFLVDDGGQDLIEYALLAGLISLMAVTAILNVGTGVNDVWTGVDGSMAAIP